LNNPKKIRDVHNSWRKGEILTDEELFLNLGSSVDGLGRYQETVDLEVSKNGDLYVTDGDDETITYTPQVSYSYDWADDTMINTVNYDGISVWWQMTNLPEYLRTWQVLSQMYNKFIT
jgi:hypothetical protein